MGAARELWGGRRRILVVALLGRGRLALEVGVRVERRCVGLDHRIPAGCVLVGRTVTVDAGTGAAGAALRLSCTGGKTLRTLGLTGNVGLQIGREYVGKKFTNVMSLGARVGDSSGVVYGVCC